MSEMSGVRSLDIRVPGTEEIRGKNIQDCHHEEKDW